jgi:NAD(P)-dependent dehydrogenase (short-subunit alcohol dehydrogenase family)
MSSKAAIVTGASRGIGAAIADLLEQHDYRVARLSRGIGDGPLNFRCDVADRTSVDAAIARAVAALGGLDLLVNNAGIAQTHRIDDADDAWRDIVATDLDGCYWCAKACAPALRRSRGRIVNIASNLALHGVGDQIAYCAAKHGVIGLTRALAMALRDDGVTVNAICPGWVQTDMADARLAAIGLSPKDAGKDFPTGRIIRPVEIAGAVLFLASDAAANMTGREIVIDGGATSGFPA